MGMDDDPGMIFLWNRFNVFFEFLGAELCFSEMKYR